MGSAVSFAELRSAEASLLETVAQRLNDNRHGEQDQLLRRDVLVEVKGDPAVSRAVVHFLELRPRELGRFTGGVPGSLAPGAAACNVEDCTAPEANINAVETAEETPPLVMLPGFGMGAAAFSACVESLLTSFPERRIFILDWPACGAGVRMPWTHEAKMKMSKNNGAALPKRIEVNSTTAGLVRNGYLQDREVPPQKEQQRTYPLPESRFAAIIDEWRQRLALQKIVLVGHSIGGFIAFTYAERYPHAIDRLVLCSPCGVPRRPDSVGISEESFRAWFRQRAQEDPDLANEFTKGTAVQRPRLNFGEKVAFGFFIFLVVVFSPLVVAGLFVSWLRDEYCPKRPVLYRTMHPSNGMPADFEVAWTPLSGLSVEERSRLYENRASSPISRIQMKWWPALLVRQGMKHFAEMRFKDNGQWLESVNPRPTGSHFKVVAGDIKEGNMNINEPNQSEAALQISRLRFSKYQYCASFFGSLDCNWGEQLFSCTQLPMGYSSFGWMRRPIGHRIETFVGLPPGFEGNTEYYTDASNSGLEATAEGNGQQAPRNNAYSLVETDLEGSAETTSQIPVGFLYGQDDWIDFRAAKLISEKVARHSGKDIPVLRLQHSGHQLFVDNPIGFVQAVRSLVPSGL